MTSITPLRIGDEGFLIASTIDRCPRVMMMRELIKNALEAAERAPEGARRVEISAVAIDGVPKLAIWNTGPGMNAEELYRMADISSSIRKQQSLDQNFGIGAKVATLPSNTHGIRYRSCAGGRVHQVVLGKREGVYGRVLQPTPGGDGLAEVIDVTDAATANGRTTEHDWTEVVLMGQGPAQNTVVDPYGDDLKVEADWLVRAIEERFFAIDSTVSLSVLANASPAGRPYDIITAAARLSARTQNYEVVESHGGMRIHYVFLEAPAKAQGLALGAERSGIALIYKNEIYDLRTDAEWLQMAPTFGVPFAARQVFIFVEIPPYWEVVPDTYRQFLRYRSEGQWQIEVRHFAPRIVAGRPAWLLTLLASFAPDASHTQEVRGEIAALMRDLKIIRRWWPTNTFPSPPSEGRGSEGLAAEPEYEVAPQIIFVREPREVEERGFGDKAAIFFEESHQVFLNCLYPAVETMRDTLAREFAGEEDQEAVRAAALVLAEQAIASRVARRLVFAFGKRSIWPTHELEQSTSPANLTLAADDYLSLLPKSRKALISYLLSEKIKAA